MTKRKKTSEEPKVEELTHDELDDVQGAGIPVEERQTLDHVGNFNFKVEIDGVSSAELKPRTSPTQLRKPTRK